jgi:hypothetical protein
MTSRSSIDFPFLHFGAGVVALSVIAGLWISLFSTIFNNASDRRADIGKFIGYEFSLGGQKMRVIGPLDGDVQVAIDRPDGSTMTTLLDFQAVKEGLENVGFQGR